MSLIYATVRFNKFGEKVRTLRHKTKNAKEKNGQFRSMRILRGQLEIISIWLRFISWPGVAGWLSLSLNGAKRTFHDN